jgi:hypothetical protein
MDKLIVGANDLHAIHVKNASDILLLLKQGAITVTDAKDLMSLIAEKTNIDLASSLIETPTTDPVFD